MYMSQKRIIASLLMVSLAFSLAACGMGKPAPSLPPLDEGAVPSSSEAETQAPRATQNSLYEEVLPNGLKITVLTDGVLLLENGNIEENLKTRNIFSDYVPNITTLKLGDGVEVVGEKTFQGWDKLQRIIIGDSVREIGYSAFSGCTALTDITFGKSVETIQAYAFTGCTALKDAVLSDSVTTVGDYAFSKCTALQNASFGSHVENMGNLIFDGCTAFTDFRTGSNISAHTFEGNTTLVSLSMDDTVTEIGERAFSGCTKLQFITWSPNLQAIRSYAFAGCTTLNALSIYSNNELSIGDNAFSKCSGLVTIDLGEGVTVIGEKAFADCTAAEKIILPKSLTRIEYGAFQNTSALRVLGYRGSNNDWWKIKFASEWGKGAGRTSPKCDYKE